MCDYAKCDETRIHGRGLCQKHYRSVQRKGRLGDYRRPRRPSFSAGAPIGTIRIRKHQRQIRRRSIKVAPDKWVAYARWWWEMNRGPIPEGMRVAHKDGDPLNDAPENLVLARPDDVLAMAQERDPSMAHRALKAAKKGTSEAQKWHWRAYRATHYLRHRAYPVDLEGRRVINRPMRCKRSVYAAYCPIPRGLNRGLLPMAAVLGWPRLEYAEASVASVLSETFASARDVQARASALRARYGHDPLNIVTVYTAMVTLRRLGLAVTVKRKYALSPLGAKERRAPCPYVAVLGSELQDQKYADFVRCDVSGRPVERAKTGSEAARLMDAIATRDRGETGPCAGCGDEDSKWRRRGLCPGCYAKLGKAMA